MRLRRLLVANAVGLAEVLDRDDRGCSWKFDHGRYETGLRSDHVGEGPFPAAEVANTADTEDSGQQD
jgi:hypothetical protein